MEPIYLDIETYSTVDLRKSNVYRYVEDPDFEVLLLGIAYGDAPVECFDDGERLQAEVERAVAEARAGRARIIAHNAPFERICFSRLLGLNVGAGEYLEPELFDDTMPLAAAHGYPARLELLGEALGGERKDGAGTRLINLFSKPGRGGVRVLGKDRPDRWAEFIAYCAQDVEVLRFAYAALPSWEADEREVWLADQRINDRGIAVDVDLVRAAIEASEVNTILDELAVAVETGVKNPGSVAQLTEWLNDDGLEVSNLRAATVEELLAGDGLTERQRRVLELRSSLALSASKKFQAALDRVNADRRLRGSFYYHGAHTGRWAGRGVQLQNLPRETLPGLPDDADGIDEAVEAAVADVVETQRAPAPVLKALVRPMFTGPLTVVDYSAIEARVIAWLAGEVWALDAFREGRDIYVETAERMGEGYGRQEGKVAVLALGYAGGVGSLRAMGARGSEAELRALVSTWRGANANIVELWAAVEAAFTRGGWAGDRIYVHADGTDRHIELPSGRSITYHRVGRRWARKTWPNGDVSDVRQLSFIDPKRFPARQDTYGGRLTENVVQAVARDVLAAALLRLEERGFRVVGHVHDEVLVETVDLKGVTAALEEAPRWARGLPINAEGYVTERYRKG